jgi:hypothetical protein
MRTHITAIAVTLAWCVAAPSAQQQREPAPQPEPAHNVFVLTGCLEAAAPPSATFKLTDASAIGRPVPATAAQSPAAGAVGTSGEKPSFELRPVSGVTAQGLDADELKAHVGERVEVVVRPIESPAAQPAGAAAAQGARPVETPAERFHVTEIKRVIGSCP